MKLRRLIRLVDSPNGPRDTSLTASDGGRYQEHYINPDAIIAIVDCGGKGTSCNVLFSSGLSVRFYNLKPIDVREALR
jgi:hypothetical protein